MGRELRFWASICFYFGSGLYLILDVVGVVPDVWWFPPLLLMAAVIVSIWEKLGWGAWRARLERSRPQGQDSN